MMEKELESEEVGDGWRVVKKINGNWQVVCPTCGNTGGNYTRREFAVQIAKLSANLHKTTNHK